MSTSKGIMVNRALFDNCKIFIVDDVVSSMNTKYEFIEKIRAEASLNNIRYEIVGIGIAVDREQSTPVYDESGKIVLGKKGKNAIQEFTSKTGIPVYRIIGIKELIGYIYKEKIPVLVNGKWRYIDNNLKGKVDEYLQLYGTS